MNRPARQAAAAGGGIACRCPFRRLAEALGKRAQKGPECDNRWLDRGRFQADGPARALCRRYATSLQDSGSEFQIGGRGAASEQPARRGAEPWVVPTAPPPVHDARWLGTNPIEISRFDSDAPWHGEGGALIEHVGLFTPDGQALSVSNGGDEVELRIACRAVRSVAKPIVGYILRTARGEQLAGDNTYLRYRDTPLPLAAGDAFTARFRMRLPYLPVGVYRFALSIIEGTQSGRVHLHWMEDALELRVSHSPVRRGAVGVPMLDIRLEQA